jgi:H+-transporting ATPase
MSTLALQPAAFSPASQSNQTVDLEKIPVERVLDALNVQPDKGLSSAEAERRRTKYGPNAIVEKEISRVTRFPVFFARAVARLHHSMASCDEDFG